MHVPPASVSEADIEAWLISYLCELLELGPDEIDTTNTLAAYGLDSSGAVGMMGDLGAWLGRELDPAIIYSYPTIETLTRHLASAEAR